MKRYTLTLFTLLVLTTISFGQLRFGAGLSLLDVDAIGVQGKVLLDLEERTGQPIDGAGTFTYYFRDGFTQWAIDIDAHYRLAVIAESIELDPIAGLQFARVGTVFGSGNEIGINLGANFTIPIESFIVYAQPKFTIGGFDALTISAGILF
jgi:hypothetical protein